MKLPKGVSRRLQEAHEKAIPLAIPALSYETLEYLGVEVGRARLIEHLEVTRKINEANEARLKKALPLVRLCGLLKGKGPHASWCPLEAWLASDLSEEGRKLLKS